MSDRTADVETAALYGRLAAAALDGEDARTEQSEWAPSAYWRRAAQPDAASGCAEEHQSDTEQHTADVEALTEWLHSRPDLGPGYMLRDDCEHLAEVIAPHVAALVREAKAEERERIAQAIESQRIVCPVHNLTDCSPLLNGCCLPGRLHARLVVDADLARRADGRRSGLWEIVHMSGDQERKS